MTHVKENPKDAGRKVFDGKEETLVLSKLEEAALVDATVEEMCFYADISPAAYYRYCEANPEFRDKVKALREYLPFKARQNISAAVGRADLNLSKWLLEKKKPNEFGEKMKIEHSGQINSEQGLGHPEDDALRAEFKERLRLNIQGRWKKKEEPEEKSLPPEQYDTRPIEALPLVVNNGKTPA